MRLRQNTIGFYLGNSDLSKPCSSLGTQQVGQPILSDLDTLVTHNSLSSLVQPGRSRPIKQAQLLVAPDRLDLDFLRHTHTSPPADRLPISGPLEVQLVPHGLERLDEMFNLFRRVAGRGRDAQTFLAAGNSGVIDGLDVNVVFGQQHVGSFLGECSVAHKGGDDVARVGHDGDTELTEASLDVARVDLLQSAVAHPFALVRDRRLGAGDDGGRERGGKDESGRVRTDDIDKVGRSGDISTDDAVCLAEGTGDNVDPVLHRALDGVDRFTRSVVRLKVEVLGHTSSRWPIHADGMHFIEESDRTILVGQITDRFDRSDRSAHGINRFESDNLGRLLRDGLQLGFEIGHVIVLEDDLFSARVADTLNHRRMVHAVRKDDTAGELAAESGETGVVGNVARAEDQRGGFAV